MPASSLTSTVTLPSWLVKYVASLGGRIWLEKRLISPLDLDIRPFQSVKYHVEFRTERYCSRSEHLTNGVWVNACNEMTRATIYMQYWRFLFDSGQTQSEYPDRSLGVVWELWDENNKTYDQI